MKVDKMTYDWLPYEETVRPADLAKCRFELFPGPAGIISIFADDYDAAGRIFRWLTGQAMVEKDLQREGGNDDGSGGAVAPGAVSGGDEAG